MDATVDDFFNEINEIAPTKVEKKKPVEVWQECYDELTGYSYYWNTKTDTVTWNAPSNYIPANNRKKLGNIKKKTELYCPPKVPPPVLPCTSKLPESGMKIYSIQKNLPKMSKPKPVPKTYEKKLAFRKGSDSEDEKIELISSYGGESESDPEVQTEKAKNEIENGESDDDENLDILAQIQQRAKELQELEKKSTSDSTSKVKSKDISGYSLVAGYSDSESETDQDEVKPIFPINDNKIVSTTPQVSHSTLFPIAQHVDVKDFETKKEPVNPVLKPTENNFDSKAFQRKRRIGISLVNTAKKTKDSEENDVAEEKKGFGFSEVVNQESLNVKKGSLYPGFQKGGVLFSKSEDTLLSLPTEKSNSDSVIRPDHQLESTDRKEVELNYTTLKEKLTFLTEGHKAVLPVQFMLIQANTLFLAMEENGLKLPYLQKWLNETCSELIKLEKEAAPAGWLLQWDRQNKRYYYQNQSTGVSQWEYPQPQPPPPDEVFGREDVPMDICTTPPHPGVPEQPMSPPSPPLPPNIRSPTPPPPPIISLDDSCSVSSIPDVPLPPSSPPPPPPPSINHHDGEPLPPGVDLPEMISYANTIKETEEEASKPSDPLNSALDSFYSEIAATEITNSPSSQDATASESIQSEQLSQTPTEIIKKKKKAKVKLAPGLSMKKKGVSQLVEKWKSVQKTYND